MRNENKIDVLKEKLNNMLEENNYELTDEIVKVSQDLDEIILEEVKKHKYNEIKKVAL